MRLVASRGLVAPRSEFVWAEVNFDVEFILSLAWKLNAKLGVEERSLQNVVSPTELNLSGPATRSSSCTETSN